MPLTEVILIPPIPHRHTGHPAKLHHYLAQELIKDYSEKGALVLDPFAGIGTVPREALGLGRLGVGIEIEEAFCVKSQSLGTPLIRGDSKEKILGYKDVDLILTSPPYGEAIGRAGDRALEKTIAAKERYEMKRFGRTQSRHSCYGVSEGNLGSLPFHRKAAESFTSEFPKFVESFVSVLKPGGHLVWVVKDQRLGRKRLGSVDMFNLVRSASEKYGMVYEGRRVAVLPDNLTTQWQRVNASRWNIPIPNAEHICVMRKDIGV